MLVQPESKIRQAISLLLAVLCLGSVTSAQSPSCALKLNQLPEPPELRGFHLGMTFDQVKARVPQIAFEKPDRIGVSKTSISPSYDPKFDKSGFADVRTISLDFLDGKLVTLWIGYEGTFKWPTLEAFVSGFSRALGLPSQWPVKRTGRQLNCDSFSVFASMIGGGPSIRIADESAQELIANRREAAAQEDDSMVIGDTIKKVYYPSDCSAVDSVAASNRTAFKDKAEAEKAGYTLAKECQ